MTDYRHGSERHSSAGSEQDEIRCLLNASLIWREAQGIFAILPRWGYWSIDDGAGSLNKADLSPFPAGTAQALHAAPSGKAMRALSRATMAVQPIVSAGLLPGVGAELVPFGHHSAVCLLRLLPATGSRHFAILGTELIA